MSGRRSTSTTPSRRTGDNTPNSKPTRTLQSRRVSTTPRERVTPSKRNRSATTTPSSSQNTKNSRPIRTQRAPSPPKAKNHPPQSTTTKETRRRSTTSQKSNPTADTPKQTTLPSNPPKKETEKENKATETKNEAEETLIQLESGAEDFFSDLDSFINESEKPNESRITWSSDDDDNEFLLTSVPSTPTFPVSPKLSPKEEETKTNLPTPAESEEGEEDNNSLYSDNGFSYVRDMLHLKGELKSKNYQLKGLIQETARLERNVSKKDKALFDLNADLHKTNERVLCLEQELESKEQENQSLRAELETLRNQTGNRVSRRVSTTPKRNKSNETTMQRLDAQYQAARTIAATTHSLDSLPEELYKHVLSLNNQLAVIERKYVTVRKENQELSSRNKELETHYQKIMKEHQSLKKQSKENALSTKQLYSEQMGKYSRAQDKLQKQVRELRSNDIMKTKRIAELESLEESYQNVEKQIHSMEQEKRAQDRKIVSLKKQISRLENESKLKDIQLSKVNESNKVFPVKMWEQDRKLIQGKMQKMKIALAQKDRTITAQKKRIVELCDRVDMIAASLHDADPESARESDVAAQINGTFHSSSFKSSQGRSPILETTLRSDDRIIPKEITIIEDDGEEAELTDDLFDFSEAEDQEGEQGSEFIPVKLYKLLEFEVQKLQKQICNMENIILQREHTIADLEQQYDLLAKQKVVNAGKETEKMVEKISTVEQENKKREKQYRLQIHKLQSQQ